MVAAPSPSPAATPQPSASAASAIHVFLIVMENRSYQEVLRQPFTAGLASEYALATDYHAVAHPSLPNYLALSSGSTWGIRDDGYHAVPGPGLGEQLTAAGISWRAYEEGMTRGCFQSPSPYVLHHNPFAYYGGECPANVVDAGQLDADLAGDTPRFSWIQPDVCHSTHSCPIEEGDQWLAQIVPRIAASKAWQEGGVLFITWDEDDGSASNQVATLVVSPRVATHDGPGSFNHYSLLATIEDLLHVPRLGAAATAQPMTQLLRS
jgi:phosphatidylinositol-3-phosphatase